MSDPENKSSSIVPVHKLVSAGLLSDLPVVPAPEHMDLDWFGKEMQGAKPAVEKKSEGAPSQTATPPQVQAQIIPGLEDIDIAFLKVVKNNPGKPSSEYPKLLGIGDSRAGKIRKKLVQMGYLKEHKVQAQRRGRSSIVLEVTAPFFISS